MSAIIDIEVAKYAPSGIRYRVWHDGEILIKSAREPLFEACRELVNLGVTGRVQMRRLGHERIDMECLIAVGATLTIVEGNDSGPRVAKFVAYGEAA